MADGLILPTLEKVDASSPRDVLEGIKACFADIDRRTDRVLEITRSVRIVREIDQIFESAELMYYLARDEIEHLRGEGGERCRTRAGRSDTR